MKKILTLTFSLLVFAFAATAQHDDHEYSHLVEKKISYRDWTYKNVLTNENMNLRDFTRDKKIVMVFYFAPWCHSSNYQAPVTQKLYEKYKDKGFAVIGVSLYGSLDHVKYTINKRKIGFPVVSESISSGDRKRTLHYKYRQKTGDYRKWGTPWNIFLVPDQIKKNGEVLTKKAFVINGELIEKEAETFIRKMLGLTDDIKDNN